MLYTEKLLAELERTRERFTSYQDRYGQQLGAYRTVLAGLGAHYGSANLLASAQTQRLQSLQGSRSAGARPTSEYDRWRAAGGEGVPVLTFGHRFSHHEAARQWAECLRGTTTFAVDGSQLLPWRDASVPIAMVQAGFFENPHEPLAGATSNYKKDVVTELLPPDELLTALPDTDARTGEALGYSTQIVHLRRFELEMRTLIERMRYHAERKRAEQRTDGGVVAFYDGSLIVSFALKMPTPFRDRYVQAARHLLHASYEYRIPLIGYIDTSYARDILTMLSTLEINPPPETAGIHDALLWLGSMGWGDRTPAFISARDDLGRMGYQEQQNDVAFVYFQAALDRPPARLEFPRWVLEVGLLDEVLDTVRGEVIAGNGYPYPVEAADAVAVISNRDRAEFYSVFQAFAEREGLAFGFSRKALSKSRRRA
jgi:NurA domain